MRSKTFASVVFGIALVCASTAGVAASGDKHAKVFYRYVNSDGVKVLHHSIPPQYAQKGYDIVSLSGKLVKRVPPALSAEEAAAKEEALKRSEHLAMWDRQLRRRYSSVADIEAAKKRKLNVLDTNILVLNSNITTTKTSIENQQLKAADVERTGRDVPQALLNVLRSLENDLEDSQEQVRLRLLEYQEVSDKFERDKRRFEVISKR